MEQSQRPLPEMSAPPYPGPPMNPPQHEDNMDKSQTPLPGMSAPPYPGPPLSHPQYGDNMVVVVTQPPTDTPGQMMCPHCQKNVITEVVYKAGCLSWCCCFIIGCFVCWPCCWIPLVVKDCKDVEHRCPDCHELLHEYKRM